MIIRSELVQYYSVHQVVNLLLFCRHPGSLVDTKAPITCVSIADNLTIGGSSRAREHHVPIIHVYSAFLSIVQNDDESTGYLQRINGSIRERTFNVK